MSTYDAIRWVQTSSDVNLHAAIERADRDRDVEFNRRVAAELREVELGAVCEERAARIRELERQGERMRETITKCNVRERKDAERIAWLEGEVRRLGVELRRAG